jgi:hypothetical protein
MHLAPGTHLGAYEILSTLGAGGMGEVYRARDTRLKREVAIEVLPDAFSRDPERLARFQREAELLATLNHPNIAAVYGFEHMPGASAIILELVEGTTLADRIAQGAIPIEEALPIPRQIAESLEAAHERGVIQELFYVAPDSRLMAASIRLEAAARTAETGSPVALFTTRLASSGGGIFATGFAARAQYDVAADGRFLMDVVQETAPPPITVVINWSAGLKP